MNKPTTSKPARFNSSAATAESTPPDRPTTIFLLVDTRRPSGKPVLDRQHQRRVAVVEEPAVDDINLLRVARAHARRPMIGEDIAPAQQRLEHLVVLEPA